MAHNSNSKIEYHGQELLECEAKGMYIYTPSNISLSFKTLPEYLILIDKILSFITNLIEKIISIASGNITIHKQLDLINTTINTLSIKINKLTTEKNKPRNSILLMKNKNNNTMRCNDGSLLEVYTDTDTDTRGRNIYCCDNTPSTQLEKHGKKFNIEYYINIINELLKKLNTLVDTIPIKKNKNNTIKTNALNINHKIDIIKEIIKKYKLQEHIFAKPSIPSAIRNKQTLKRRLSNQANENAKSHAKRMRRNVNGNENEDEYPPIEVQVSHNSHTKSILKKNNPPKPSTRKRVHYNNGKNPKNNQGEMGEMGDLGDLGDIDAMYKAIFEGAFSPK